MSISCGVDIIEINRIKDSLVKGNSAFKDRVYTSREVDYCESERTVRYESYAARFAAKEAVSKAFGIGIGSELSWKDIEILNDKLGKPYVVLHNNAGRLFENIGGNSISLSLSHCRDYAVAYVVVEAGK